jgi:GNAT superfamily N-acetyltransferase
MKRLDVLHPEDAVHVGGQCENLYLYIEPVDSDRIHERIGTEQIVDQQGLILATRGETFTARHGNITGGRYLMLNEEDGAIIAGVNYTTINEHTVVSNIYVRPDKRRQGVATRLIEAMQDDFPHLVVDNNLTELGALFFGYPIPENPAPSVLKRT